MLKSLRRHIMIQQAGSTLPIGLKSVGAVTIDTGIIPNGYDRIEFKVMAEHDAWAWECGNGGEVNEFGFLIKNMSQLRYYRADFYARILDGLNVIHEGIIDGAFLYDTEGNLQSYHDGIGTPPWQNPYNVSFNSGLHLALFGMNRGNFLGNSGVSIWRFNWSRDGVELFKFKPILYNGEWNVLNEVTGVICPKIGTGYFEPLYE